ncbi:hypothetical protein [Brevundimonas sp.]|uniref:hypothetical protein n=1 Tax=Brevundimonas sp. TaxID=1871086 RepID=UPI002899C6E7|nr:hypothetical protein [Brevundimonas sp.]
MRKQLCLIAVGAGLTVATPTNAEWQNTNWEMSRAEVVRVTGAQVVEGTKGQSVGGADLGAAGTYSALGFNFRSLFFFDRTDRLRLVKIVMDDVDRCDDLQQTMEGIYGNPVESMRISQMWIDGKSGDEVRYTDARRPPIVNECFVAYSPAAPSGGRGL